jgi:eukaryotic-like serine/threonine-protein kinase
MVGTTLGHYRLVQLLGRGGMGEVYLAEDTRLHRQVAVKVLARELGDDPDRRQRFEREARAVAALNHPNIVTIHSVEDSGRQIFLTLELVEGQTLGTHIPERGLPLDRLLAYAIPLTDAVGAAHQRGITHRDLKPANVMVTTDGRVKVLDFGLAKVKEAAPSPETMLPPTMELTGEGRILGTAAYMSPEQAEGKPVDARSDVFSLGVMLYEMATGERPFKGETQVALISSIIKDTPSSVTDLKRDLPRELSRIVHRCLKKDPEDRYQTAKDLRNDLRALKEDLSSGELQPPAPAMTAPTSAPVPGRRIPAVSIGIGVAVFAVAVSAAYWWRAHQPVDVPAGTTRPFQNVALTRLTNLGTATRAALSGDGRYVAYVVTQDGKSGVALRQVQTGSTVQIVPPAAVRYVALTFSPDSNYVYYATYPEGQSIATLYQVPVLGGGARRVVEDVDGNISFAPDGTRFAFARGKGSRQATLIMVADAQGANVRELATRQAPGGFLLSSVAWSPDGKSIAAAAFPGSDLRAAIVLVDPATGQERTLGSTRWRGLSYLAWVPDGTALLINAQDQAGDASNQIWLVPTADGEPRRVTNDLNTYSGLSLSKDGRSFVTVLNDRRARVWIVPQGDESKAQAIAAGAGIDDGTQGIDWTSDGRIVYSTAAAGNADIWVMDPDGSNRVQLTNMPDNESWPRASAHGKTIVFVAERNAQRELWRMDRDGGGQKRLGPHSVGPRPSISADGKWAYYTVGFVNYRISTDGGEPVELVTDAEERKKLPPGVHEPVPSPDGRLIAMHYSDEAQSGERIVVVGASGPVTPRLFRTVTIPILWSADSQGLVYAHTQGGVINLWQQPLSGGNASPITHFTSERIFGVSLSPDNKRWAVVRGDVTADVVLVSQR